MSVYKRKNSKHYYCEIRIAGKTIIRSTRTTKKSLALRFEARLRDRIYSSSVLGQASPISIRNAIGEFRAHKQATVSGRNLVAVCKALEVQLTRVISLDFDFVMLSRQHLTKLIELRRADGVSEGTIKQLMVSVTSLINYVGKLGYIAPDIDVPVIKVRNQRLRVLSGSEEVRLIEVLNSRGDSGSDDLDLFLLLLDTAARLNEIQQMTWPQVDIDNGVINLWRSKNGTEGVIKLTDRCMEVLQNRLAKQKHEVLVFPSATGSVRRTTPKTLSKAYREAGLEGFTTHCLRHTACTRLLSNSMPIHMVSGLMGHRNLLSTSRYAHASALEVADHAVKILNAYS